MEEVSYEWDSEEGKEPGTDKGVGRRPLCTESYFRTLSTMRMALFLKI